MRLLAFALLVVLTACVRPPFGRVEPEPFPPVPAFVDSPLGPVPVVFMDSIPTDQSGYVVLGRFMPLNREILIWKGVKGRGEQWRVLLHKKCHLRSWDRGVRFTDPGIEQMCDVMAYEVAALLRSKH